MKNLYCRNSKLSSWCLRLLIERYIAGDTAPEAKQFIEGVPKTDDQGDVVKDAGGKLCWAIKPHLEPAHTDMEAYFNQFLLIDAYRYKVIAAIADETAAMHPSYWKEIKISRVTVSRYFLLLGKYCWEKLVSRTYYDVVNRRVGFTLSIQPTHFESLDEGVEKVMQVYIEQYVKGANGTLIKEKTRYIRESKMMAYLKQRSKKFNGLKLKYAREHVAWASLVEETEARNAKRTDLACVLVFDLLDEPINVNQRAKMSPL